MNIVYIILSIIFLIVFLLKSFIFIIINKPCMYIIIFSSLFKESIPYICITGCCKVIEVDAK